jgi:hypothetical protein
MALGNGLLEGSVKTHLVNQTKAGSTNLQLYPTVLLYIVELLAEQIDIKTTLSAML